MDPLSSAPKPRRGLLFYVGSGGLLCVMLVEAAAVLGRHVGFPVTGALEIVQAAIVPAACAGMLIATARRAHAAVHMLTDRLSPSARVWIRRIEALLAALFFAALAYGATLLAREFWNSFEQSEVLHIPFRPLRVLVALTAAALAVAFARAFFRPGDKP
ncbi:MAG TPA: TRAP transporter small permease subunit [Steroidobacteraceae bacterium]|nr:TRAP transporter small permease subunit [Steroidobacteraceae bacterium]